MTDHPCDPKREAEYLAAFELHSPDAMRRALAAGAGPDYAASPMSQLRKSSIAARELL